MIKCNYLVRINTNKYGYSSGYYERETLKDAEKLATESCESGSSAGVFKLVSKITKIEKIEKEEVII